MNTYRLYVKFEGQKKFSPVNWREGRQVVNLIYASLFTENEIELVKEEMSLPENSSIQYRFKRVD